MNELLTTKQVQEMLRVDRTTIYRMLKDGRLHGVKVGSQWRFQATEINAILYGTPAAPPISLPQGGITTEPLPKAEPSPIICLQAVQDVSAEMVGIGAIITDNDGLPVSNISNSCYFCDLIRSTESGQQACANSWNALSHQVAINPKFTTCHAGLQIVRARIEVNSVTTSIFVAGQFYTAMPETAVQQQYIKQLADTHGINAAALDEAIYDIPILSPAKQGKLMEWLKKLANTFSVIGQERAEMIERFRRIISISDLENSPIAN